ncbi:MAG: right-handed parallel beta-helix repeat-containing protein [Euryarchaeota archaeon]|nr:right-handed parallel beta-helix repeat-containing protein [Euryarchaeota archaeon]
MQTKTFTVLIALGVLLALVISTAVPRVNAAELKVGPSAQYHTISEAVKAANTGDTVFVAPGTYVEDVMVDKPLRVVATNSSAAATIVKATAPNKDVFTLSGSDITIQGFTITGGNYGVTFAKASNCVLTRCVVKDNTYGVYLAGATSNLISNNNLNNNGFGMYLDGSSGNKLVNNSARYERGGGGKASLSDGIYMHSSNANNVTRCDLSNNNNFGASLYDSRNNAFSYNTLSANTQFGVRLRDGSDYNRFVHNTFRANAENGVLIGNSTGNAFYFNDFLEEKSHFYSQENNNINSTRKVDYTYSGSQFNGFVGNYYSDYVGTDADGNGIGDSSFSRDKFPLVKPMENYREGWPTPTPIPSVASAKTASIAENVTNDTQNDQRAAALPGFEWISTLFGLLVAALIFAVLQRAKALR